MSKRADEVAVLRKQLAQAHAEIAALRRQVDTLEQPQPNAVTKQPATWGTIIGEYCEQISRERGETFDSKADVSRYSPSDMDLLGFCVNVVHGDISDCLSEGCLRETAPCFYFLALRFLRQHAKLPNKRGEKGPFIAALVDSLIDTGAPQEEARKQVAAEERMEYSAVAKNHQTYGKRAKNDRE
jgi:hypothetical protein